MPSVGKDRTIYKLETIAACVRELNNLAKHFKRTGGYMEQPYTLRRIVVVLRRRRRQPGTVDKVRTRPSAEKQFRRGLDRVHRQTDRNIVLKAARMRIPLVASGLPSARAIDIAVGQA
jgi:hypothetical protein